MKKTHYGLMILKRRDYSLKATEKAMEKCEKPWRRFEDDYGCDNCDKKAECDKEFDYQVDNRKGYSWRLREHSSKRADAKGSGPPDNTGDWMSAGKLPHLKEMPVLRY